MEKLFFAIIFSLLLVVGCSKQESTIDNPNDNVSNNDTKEARIIRTTACVFWYRYEDGECLEQVFSDSLCYITLGCDYPDLPIDAVVQEDYDGITSVKLLNYLTFSPKNKLTYENYLERGFISFKEDCIIDDDKLETDYISAGSYPVSLVNNDMVIDFAHPL